jgi:hypothetical protein
MQRTEQLEEHVEELRGIEKTYLMSVHSAHDTLAAALAALAAHVADLLPFCAEHGNPATPDVDAAAQRVGADAALSALPSAAAAPPSERAPFAGGSHVSESLARVASWHATAAGSGWPMHGEDGTGHAVLDLPTPDAWGNRGKTEAESLQPLQACQAMFAGTHLLHGASCCSRCEVWKRSALLALHEQSFACQCALLS